MEKNWEKLPVDFKEKWVAALRSGEYKQGTNSLVTRTDDGYRYCCLGVAGKIGGLTDEQMSGKSLLDTIKDDFNGLETLQATSIPECLYRRPSEYSLMNGLACKNDGVSHSYMNTDGIEYSFNEIADWIEENL